MICDCICFSISSATETIINSPVAENALTNDWSIARNTSDGMSAINARKIAPNSVILLEILDK